MIDIEYLQKKKQKFERKLNNAGPDDPFIQHYRNGIRIYEEELQEAYERNKRWLG